MEGTRQTIRDSESERHFRDQIGYDTEEPVEAVLHSDGPLEVNMTDEPGGDPYNHTGRFKRMYR